VAYANGRTVALGSSIGCTRRASIVEKCVYTIQNKEGSAAVYEATIPCNVVHNFKEDFCVTKNVVVTRHRGTDIVK